ncbi:dUTP diphosphatase [Mycoplasma sp. 1654_15]|uniref:dUTP diphosphatase n=1 Tax=Mycoplasma sp. 1654_15 TaxID=2725994 RepID=UPI0014490889|nr:dUTP diphosphatase [Mycoplasma sp. 1654_15]QJB71004.1 dUTPase [Mycoplasma sp. 1654_15]
MNFRDIFEQQKKLDLLFIESMKERKQEVNPKKISEQKVMALIVEIAEFANEIESFKYWKVNKKNNVEKVKEEYVDAIHFLSSLAIEHNLSFILEAKIVENKDLDSQFLKTFYLATKFGYSTKTEDLKELFEYFLGFISLLEFTFDEIKTAYLNKARINIERIKSNY